MKPNRVLPIIVVLAALVACDSGANGYDGPGTVAQLDTALQARIAEIPGASVAVAYVDPVRGDTLLLNADTSFHAASTMKVPVLVELFRWHDEGRLNVNDSLVLRNEFRSVLDGSTYSLTTASDSDSSLYARVGTPVPFVELARLMIVRSSNLATNALIDTLGAGRVQRTTDSLGAAGMRVLRGVEDLPAFRAGMSNTTNAWSLAALFLSILEGRAATEQSTEAMLEILLAQELRNQIPAGLPEGTRVAHKTGSITAIMHDAGIVYPADRGPYVIVVLTGGITEPAISQRLTADIAGIVHAFATR